MLENLPKPVAAYFAADKEQATNLLAHCFADNAVVRDEGRTFKGLHAIQAWKAETKRKYHPTIEPLEAEEREGKTVVTSKVSGNFPGSPVTLEFSFELDGEKIISLEIH